MESGMERAGHLSSRYILFSSATFCASSSNMASPICSSRDWQENQKSVCLLFSNDDRETFKNWNVPSEESSAVLNGWKRHLIPTPVGIFVTKALHCALKTLIHVWLLWYLCLNKQIQSSSVHQQHVGLPLADSSDSTTSFSCRDRREEE